MTKTRFTPAPWKAQQVTSGFRRPKPEAGDFQIVSKNLHCPAIVWGQGDEGKANANLIATAPELYATLDELKRELQELQTFHLNENEIKTSEDIKEAQKLLYKIFAELEKRATKTLAKARGE